MIRKSRIAPFIMLNESRGMSDLSRHEGSFPRRRGCVLSGKRSGYERIQCSEKELNSAWQAALIDVLTSPDAVPA